MFKYRLYYSPGACSLAPHIALEELGYNYEACRIVIAGGEQKKPEYLKINPRGRVPALVIIGDDGEQVLTESIAIMYYLAQLDTDSRLLPTGYSTNGSGLPRALEWMAWLSSNVHQGATRAVIRPESFAETFAGQEDVLTQGQLRVRSAYDDIEARLRGRKWALDDCYSLVDAYLLVFYRWGGKCGISMRAEYPEFTRVMDCVRARDPVKKVIEAQGITIE